MRGTPPMAILLDFLRFSLNLSVGERASAHLAAAIAPIRGDGEEQPMSDYLANVRKFDAGADEEVVAKIVRHLGIALRNRDSANVACSDKAELDRVRQSWCMKKLGVSDAAAADDAIARACEAMTGDRSKNRVTFYYLVAKDLGLLGSI